MRTMKQLKNSSRLTTSTDCYNTVIKFEQVGMINNLIKCSCTLAVSAKDDHMLTIAFI